MCTHNIKYVAQIPEFPPNTEKNLASDITQHWQEEREEDMWYYKYAQESYM